MCPSTKEIQDRPSPQVTACQGGVVDEPFPIDLDGRCGNACNIDL